MLLASPRAQQAGAQPALPLHSRFCKEKEPRALAASIAGAAGSLHGSGGSRCPSTQRVNSGREAQQSLGAPHRALHCSFLSALLEVGSALL